MHDPCHDQSWGGCKKVLSNIEQTPIVEEVEAIIIYVEPDLADRHIRGDDNLSHVRFKSCPQEVKIKVLNLAEAETIANAKTIHFCGEEFKSSSSIRKIYFFGEIYMYEIIIKMIN